MAGITQRGAPRAERNRYGSAMGLMNGPERRSQLFPLFTQLQTFAGTGRAAVSGQNRP